MNLYTLRLLDPSRDRNLYEAAYSWRSKPKSHVQPDRMPFEDFVSNNPRHLTIGLFNGELRAVYFLNEFEPSRYEAHFSSQRDTPRDVLLAAAAQVASDFFTAGATEICAWVTKRNRPLRSFLEALGFIETETKQFAGQNDTDGTTLPSERNKRIFVRYSLKRTTDPFP